MNPPTASTSTSAQASVTLGVRKHEDSETSDNDIPSEYRNQRPRISTSSFSELIHPSFSRDSERSISTHGRPNLSALAFPSSHGQPISTGLGVDGIARRASLFGADLSSSTGYTPTHQDRSLRRQASFPTTSSRYSVSRLNRDSNPPLSVSDYEDPTRRQMRLAASALLTSETSAQISQETSTRHCIRNTQLTIDYAPPPTTPSDVSARLLSCSANNVIYFTRLNRVNYKNLESANEKIGQLLKLKDTQGDLRALELGTKLQSDIMAVGTSKGYIQLWDVRTKKITTSWHAKPKDLSALAWNENVLTVGSVEGVIRHYDIRVPARKMNKQSKKVSRHEGQITTLAWNEDGKYLASADARGQVLCWDKANSRGYPMDVGEAVQSRSKKIMHNGRVSSLAWCPWSSKLLATGDMKGILRMWNVNSNERSNALPSKLDARAEITGIHFSAHWKAILTTHGTKVSEPGLVNFENALAVHTIEPKFSTVSTFRLPGDQNIGFSVLDSTGTKLIYQTPTNSRINVCEVWHQPKKKRETLNIFGLDSAGAYSLIR